ncbi:hypothetical protein G4D82_09720 [Flavobacterium sp. CYK-4]|uniref:hypothetical protein n=1 Tax=Flavobacterium lotistagni TaxID=2709660 RepID=UPI00140AEEF4|nr:hypothetical protein [Flavobacterium lotistagni]NHM07497.1 hypothetical protein [Flavobacterium lotistagni]
MTHSEQRIDFWQELWQNLINNFLKKSNLGLNLYNPHILIEDILTEIEENSFQNTDNKKFLYRQLDNFFRNDSVIKSEFNSAFRILRKNFNSNKTQFIVQILKELKISFTNGKYFDSCLSKLVELLVTEEPMTRDSINEIKYISQVIIVEFIKKNYSVNDIKQFPKKLFSDYEHEDDGRTVTDFPHGIDYRDYEKINGKTEDKFYNDVISLMNNLTVEKRIKSLSNFYYKKPLDAHYIFTVKGLKGNVCIEVGGVTFYSIDKKRYTSLPEDLDDDRENLQRIKDNGDLIFLQAAVPVKYLSPESSINSAISRLENALDLISCYYNTQTPLEIDYSRYIIVHENEWIYWSSSNDTGARHTRFHNSLNFSEIEPDFKELKGKNFFWENQNETNPSVLKLRNAIHWYRKAQESLKDEDKLLNYWISIENLFYDSKIFKDIINPPKNNKFYIIQEIISSNQIPHLVYEYGWELYWHYANQSQIIFGKPKIELPKELIEKANLNITKGQIYLEKFINNLDDIKNYETNEYFRIEIENAMKFFKDVTETKKIIKAQLQQTQDDILMIYRFRNLIVHNAHFDSTLLKYYAWKLKQYSGNFIRSIIKHLETDNSLNDVILKIQYERELFENELENGKFNPFKK